MAAHQDLRHWPTLLRFLLDRLRELEELSSCRGIESRMRAGFERVDRDELLAFFLDDFKLEAVITQGVHQGTWKADSGVAVGLQELDALLAALAVHLWPTSVHQGQPSAACPDWGDIEKASRHVRTLIGRVILPSDAN
ncbi:MAG: hypothetical protein JNM10_04500 [Planctomycetia bacterium]|nr:hypothetical protein [Planctomycetia bacterium]